MSFHVGQKVVCVVGFDPAWDGERYPSVGQTYTIREFHEGDALRVEELINPKIYMGGKEEAAFYCRKFRPVIERKTETGMAILRKLLKTQTVGDPAHVSKKAGVA